ncbi:MAG: hypothetical protein PHV59_10480, partial [Victivallales bacterium]|nr:hypothetical protein [Victivallales bacterium]
VFMAVAVAYFYVGIFSLPLVLFFRLLKWKHLKPALPFSCCWFGGMLLLYACFWLIGPLLGNIVQSTRGTVAVILGALFARFGWMEYEQHLPHSLLARRIVATLLITAAIILYTVI